MSPALEFSYSPWSGAPRQIGKRRFGVLFGGGKDSMTTLATMHEAFGPDEILAIRWDIPYREGDSFSNKVVERNQRFYVQPIEEILGIKVARVWTDRSIILVKEHYQTTRTHFELLVTASLPLFLAWGVESTTFSYPFLHFPVQFQADGSYDGVARNTRHESLKLERRHYERVLGIDLEVTNPQLPFCSTTSFALLAARYPQLVGHVTSCIDGRRRASMQHCLFCSKCMELALGFLAHGVPSPSIDYNLLFGTRAIWDRVTSPDSRRNSFGNAPMQEGFTLPVRYHQVCGYFARIDPALIADQLNTTARDRLRWAIERWGNTEFPEYYAIPGNVAEVVQDQPTKATFAIAAKHFEVVDVPRMPHQIDQPGLIHDLRIPLRPYTADVEHLQ